MPGKEKKNVQICNHCQLYVVDLMAGHNDNANDAAVNRRASKETGSSGGRRISPDKRHRSVSGFHGPHFGIG
jgi:hypothetical protein